MIELQTRTLADIKSSAVYQVLLYFDAWYFGAFVVVQLLLFTYKGIVLPYRSGIFVSELLLLLLLAIVEYLRNFLGRKGNLTEHVLGVVLSLVLTVPSLAGTLYYLLWQTYVLHVDVILVSIQLVFQAFQTILAIFCIVNFSR